MIFRLTVALIVAFWLVMTGLLVRSVYFPEHSRVLRFEPAHVLELFLGREKGSHLLLKQRPGGATMGGITLSRSKIGAGKRPPVEVKIAGWASFPSVTGSERVRIQLRGDMRFDTERRVSGFNLEARFESARAVLRMWNGEGDDRLRYRFDSDGRRVLDSESHPPEALAGMALEAAGLPRGSAEPFHGLAMAKPAVRAYWGTTQVSGKRLNAYIARVSLADELALTVAVSKLGDILRVSTPFGVELIPDTLDF